MKEEKLNKSFSSIKKALRLISEWMKQEAAKDLLIQQRLSNMEKRIGKLENKNE